MSIPEPPKPSVPRLYRYQSAAHLEWLESVLLNNEIYIPSVGQLDDSFDARPKFGPTSRDQLIEIAIREVENRNPGWTSALRQAEGAKIRSNINRYSEEKALQEFNKVMNNLFEEYRVYSLTKRFDNNALWASYGGDHAGYCLEFANLGEWFIHAREVSYGPPVALALTDPEFRKGNFLYYKDEKWSQQEEIRLVLPRGKGIKTRIKPQWLTRVILGTRMSAANRAVISIWARERRPTPKLANAVCNITARSIALQPL